MSGRVKVKLDAETQRIVDWISEKLGMTPEQVLDEAVKEYLKEQGYSPEQLKERGIL